MTGEAVARTWAILEEAAKLLGKDLRTGTLIHSSTYRSANTLLRSHQSALPRCFHYQYFLAASSATTERTSSLDRSTLALQNLVCKQIMIHFLYSAYASEGVLWGEHTRKAPSSSTYPSKSQSALFIHSTLNTITAACIAIVGTPHRSSYSTRLSISHDS